MTESSRLELLHHVAVRHASTHQPVEPLRATVRGGSPRGWTVVIRGGDVAVSAWKHLDAKPGPQTLDIEVADPLVAIWLAESSVSVPLDSDELLTLLEPAHMTLTIDLVDADGRAERGRTVEARAKNGTRVPLPEVLATPGTYRSAPRVWGPSFTPLALLVDDKAGSLLTVDFRSADTRSRVVIR